MINLKVRNYCIIDNDQNPISIPNIKINLTNSNQTTTAYNARFEKWPSGKTGVYVSHPYFDIFGTCITLLYANSFLSSLITLSL